MNRKNFVIGFLVLVAIASAFYLLRDKTPKMNVTETNDFEESLMRDFNYEIPEGVEKANLEDVTGGDSVGIATRDFEDGRFTHTVVADLPEPEEGTFYEGWLVRGKTGEANFDFFSTGKMFLGKGGYVLEFESSTNYPDYTGVVITLEKIDDKNPETHVLEGAF